MVYPRLRDFCRSLGLGFDVVSMRWGVLARSGDEDLTSKLCIGGRGAFVGLSIKSSGPLCHALIFDNKQPLHSFTKLEAVLFRPVSLVSYPMLIEEQLK